MSVSVSTSALESRC